MRLDNKLELENLQIEEKQIENQIGELRNKLNELKIRMELLKERIHNSELTEGGVVYKGVFHGLSYVYKNKLINGVIHYEAIMCDDDEGDYQLYRIVRDTSTVILGAIDITEEEYLSVKNKVIKQLSI